ncbi:glycosyltransferase family 4 protein [Saccharicrinis sp. 156]|uniref:glycosyltransferase family 4 protein n=1 Tax=Saccharicrinis sp. 156 TaxID=3417574 RepID=UPI003D3266BF
MKKLAIISTHPIQYNAPWFAMLSKKNGIKLKVFYTWSQKGQDNYDPDFNQKIDWDIPLLEGYPYTFVNNTAKTPGGHRFNGIVCPSLIKEIREWGATHVLVFGWNYKAHFKAMRYFKGKIPVLFRGDSTLLDYEIRSIKSLVSSIKNNCHPTAIFSNLKSYGKYKLRKAFLSYIYRHIDTAFYVGQNNKAYFLEHGLKENQLVFVPHAIDNNRFFDSEEKQYEAKARRWRTELGIKEDDVVLLYAGKFESKKNPLFLLDIFKELSSDNKHLKLIFLGSGPLESQLKANAKSNSNIFFLPFQNQSTMPVVYRLSNIFCLPSQGPGETWGLAVNEALACGRPVIASDKVGCAIDLIPNTSCFKSGDIYSLIHILQTNLDQIHRNKKEWFQNIIMPWNFNTLAENLTAYIQK